MSRVNPWEIGGAVAGYGRDAGDPPPGYGVDYVPPASLPATSAGAQPVLINTAPWLQFQGVTYAGNGPVGTWAQIVASNPNLKYLIVQNQHATDTVLLYIGTPSLTTLGIKVLASGYYEWNDHVPVNGVWATSTTANSIPLVIVSG
ncbi:MAG: hypothetical protein KGJ90_07075 [Patescibacteria group bacterium]|nr:hypothetical protein [Patescibacteria group bacterium]